MASDSHGRIPSIPPTGAKPASLISDAKLRELYSTMLQCRLLEAHLRSLKSQRVKGNTESQAGREAVFVAAAINLRRGDWTSASPGVILPGYVAGTSEPAILGESANPPLATSSAAHLSVPVASSVLSQATLAGGVALALMKAGKSKVVSAFLGREGGKLERWREALEYAAAHTLPVIFYTERTSVPGHEKPATAKTSDPQQPGAMPMPVIPVDGCDVVALYRVAFESLHKARNGGGPTVIEAVLFHSPSRKPARPSTQSDPILRMEEYLSAKGLFSEEWKQHITWKFTSMLENAAAHGAR